jgi:hypothetical protein
MTVRELQAKLTKLNPNLEVIMSYGYESDLFPINLIEIVHIKNSEAPFDEVSDQHIYARKAIKLRI